jgi:hypothetical protein
MVLDLLSLMGAYAAGTCRDTLTTIYSSLLVGFVFFYVVAQVTVASCVTDTGSGGVPEGQVEERQPVPDDALASVAGGNPHHSGPGGVVAEVKEEEEERHPVPDNGAVEKEEERKKAKEMFRKVKVLMAALASVPGNNPQSSSGISVPNNVEQDKAKERFRKVLMLLATFAVSITYSAGLGFWDSAGAGHPPGDAILKDRHNTRLAVFFCFNTMAFVASLLIIVVLLDTKPHRHLRRHAVQPHRRVQRRQLQADRHHRLRVQPHPCRSGVHFVPLLCRRSHPRHMGSNKKTFQVTNNVQHCS